VSIPDALADGGPVLALGCGLGVGAGLTLILSAFRGRSTEDDDALTGTARWPLRRMQPGGGSDEDDNRWLMVAVAVGAGVLVGVFTRWPVAAVLAGVGVWALPRLLGGDPRARGRVARVEGIASWTEMLRDTLAAAAGLEQAIAATASTAPAAIRPQVQDLQYRLETGERLTGALHEFADDLRDPTGDLVVSALVLASQHQARQLGDLLASLASSAREQVTMRQRVEAGRASTRTSVRIIVSATLVMAAGMVLLNRPYLQPYDSVGGQLALSLIAVVFAFALWWLGRIADVREPARVLTNLHTLSSRTPPPAASGDGIRPPHPATTERGRG
jgi:Flp pilus assembly protein TadB